MKQIIKSGNRVYIFKTVEELPSLEELYSSPEDHMVFINSITLNLKKVNAQLYSHFSEDTYKLFIYALAYRTRYFSTSQSSLFGQFEMNTRRIKRLCTKRGIILSDAEKEVLDFCINISKASLLNKERPIYSQKLCSKLRNEL